MLLRNLDPPRLCNGTCLQIVGQTNHVIQGVILGGQYGGETALIPRIPLIPTNLFLEFKRLQFPVRLAFAMTINKSQGQSLEVAGVDLSTPCFSHGQLYVALSRVGSPRGLHVYARDKITQNIVCYQTLK